MKTLLFTSLLAISLTATLPGATWASGPSGGNRGSRLCTAATLSQEEVDDLFLMREEEKMARDLYLSFNRLYGARVRLFANIAAAEQTHMNAVKQLLMTYGLPDPVTSNKIGVFTSPALRELYSQLLATGQANLTSALAVGVTVEEVDIKDLGQAIATSNEACIDKVYLNLLRGSENHLRAFNRQLP